MPTSCTAALKHVPAIAPAKVSLHFKKDRLPVCISRPQTAHVCRAMARNAKLSAPVTLSSLRKQSKAQLVSQAQQLELEDNGTKEVLIGRLLAALNSSTGTYKLKQTASQEEVKLLQAEVADLDAKLGALNLTLSETTAAREAERQQLTAIIAEMSSMRDQWQHDVQQADTLSYIAGHLDQSERDILNLRSQQTRFAERIALMQRLLKEREQEVVSLMAQLSEFRQPALVLAGAASTWNSSSALAVEQASFPGGPALFSAAVAVPSWANDWSAAPQKTDAPVYIDTAPVTAQPALPVMASAVSHREQSSRQHKAPAVAIVAALQKGGEAWDAVKSVLPQDKKFIADLVLAASATAAYISLCT